MAVSYTCPNPDCGVTLKTPNRVAPGKKVKCPKCGTPFAPEAAEPPADAPGAGTFKLADAEPKKPAAAPPPKNPMDDDEEDAESIKKGYGVIGESAAEAEEAKKNKPKFTEVEDKFKKSARGPAISMLVMPANLLIAEGLITAILGLVMFLIGIWPLVFNDAPPGDEETEDAVVTMILAMTAFGWGALICFGASKMQELGSYTWAMMGAVLGVLPLLVGIFAIIMLQNPKVKAGFEETEGGQDEDEDEDGEKAKKDGEDADEDDEDEDDEDEDDEDE